MIPKEVLKNIRRIQITTSRMVTDVFAGQYHSVFKGRGMEFDEVREYYPGDDIRSIDWNVTARTGSPHIKKFVEFLNELLYLSDKDGMFFSRFRVQIKQEENEWFLKGKVYGEKINQAKHKIKTEAKAASYSQLKVENKNGKWTVQCIVDV